MLGVSSSRARRTLGGTPLSRVIYCTAHRNAIEPGDLLHGDRTPHRRVFQSLALPVGTIHNDAIHLVGLRRSLARVKKSAFADS